MKVDIVKECSHIESLNGSHLVHIIQATFEL